MGRVSVLAKIPFGSAEYQAASEHLHQSAFVELMDTQFREFHDLFYAIPNGGSRNKIEAINLVLEGVKAGIPDTHLPLGTFLSDCGKVVYVGFPVGNCTVRSLSLYLEFKDMKRSAAPSDKQIAKIARLRQYGNHAWVVHGWKQAECAWLCYLGRMQPSEAFMVSGLNMAEQIAGNYKPDSWQIPQ